MALGGGHQYLQKIPLAVDRCLGHGCDYINLDNCGICFTGLYQLFTAADHGLGNRDYYFDFAA
jgi:hypothetical protein